MTAAELRLPRPPPDRGPLLTPAAVADMIGDVSEAWVRRTVPYKVRLGHSTVRWYERDVREWLEACRETNGNQSVDKREGVQLS